MEGGGRGEMEGGGRWREGAEGRRGQREGGGRGNKNWFIYHTLIMQATTRKICPKKILYGMKNGQALSPIIRQWNAVVSYCAKST